MQETFLLGSNLLSYAGATEKHKIWLESIVLQFKISKNLSPSQGSLLILAHCACSYGTDALNPS